MKKNLYYHEVFKRRNVVKETTLNIFFALSSWSRLLIEVFLRRKFGERYFSMATAVIMTIILFFIPIGLSNFEAKISGNYYNNPDGFFMIILKNITWYLFLGLFMFQCWKRQQEIKRDASKFDFSRFSLSTGEIHPLFYKIKVKGKYADHRVIATFLEPAFFWLVGIVLVVMQQRLGMLLVNASICYSLSWYGAYRKGDEFVLDKIDERICNEELVDAFVNEANAEDTRGFQFMGKRPANPEFRKKVVETFFEEDRDFADAF